MRAVGAAQAPDKDAGGTVDQGAVDLTQAATGLGSAGGSIAVEERDFVEVRIPAVGAYLSVLRTATAGLAARLDFTLDEIEDLRIAVDESCAMLLQKAVEGTSLTCRFDLAGSALAITVSAPTSDGKPPARDTFAWTVLTALAGEVDAVTAEDGRTVAITMVKRRDGLEKTSE
jgi:serine/threonine-protein kinase RsbW